jgi:hypothetical protein
MGRVNRLGERQRRAQRCHPGVTSRQLRASAHFDAARSREIHHCETQKHNTERDEHSQPHIHHRISISRYPRCRPLFDRRHPPRPCAIGLLERQLRRDVRDFDKQASGQRVEGAQVRHARIQLVPGLADAARAHSVIPRHTPLREIVYRLPRRRLHHMADGALDRSLSLSRMATRHDPPRLAEGADEIPPSPLASRALAPSLLTQTSGGESDACCTPTTNEAASGSASAIPLEAHCKCAAGVRAAGEPARTSELSLRYARPYAVPTPCSRGVAI